MPHPCDFFKKRKYLSTKVIKYYITPHKICNLMISAYWCKTCQIKVVA
jgi:hypothetical protein